MRVLEADNAAKRGLLWLTAAGVVAEEEDEETRVDGVALVADRKEKKLPLRGWRLQPQKRGFWGLCGVLGFLIFFFFRILGSISGV
ncbi:hypothetical protein OIU78_025200, partial [Salix suchowensis]